MAATRLVIDCDPGIDDAIALLLATASPELELVAVTAVGGNNGLDRTAPNALRILELAGRGDVPVSAGAARPLVWPLEQRATAVHGGDGLGDAGLGDPAGAWTAGTPRTCWARSMARRWSRSGRSPTSRWRSRAGPTRRAAIRRLVWMGGAFSGGNVTPAAEFNAWWDPEAAARVLQAGLELVIVPLDATKDATVGPAEIARLAPEAAAMLATTCASTTPPTASRSAGCTTRWPSPSCSTSRSSSSSTCASRSTARATSRGARRSATAAGRPARPTPGSPSAPTRSGSGC